MRIYLGTEAGQYRAERLFIYSVDKFRDPSRTYEIHLMKDVRGYDRRRWLTGFTNYRFAIAQWAYPGRAIYNDVDQIWLSDPGELFDSDMGGKGFLAISPDDTAVMLIDCDKMRSLWTQDLINRSPRKRVEKLSYREWGKLENCWHGRDFDYVEGYTKCLHYTTLHQQPWRPFPEVLVYMTEPLGHIWHEMERESDEIGYCAFDFTSEDTLYTGFVSRLRALRRLPTSDPIVSPAAPPCLEGLRELLAQAGAGSVLAFTVAGPGDGVTDEPAGHCGGAEITTFDPTAADAEGADVPQGPFDAVVCAAGLELLSDEDVPWVLERLMQRAGSAFFVAVDDTERNLALADGGLLSVRSRGSGWWRKWTELAARSQPHVRWRLGVQRRTSTGKVVVDWWERGRRLEASPPRVWVLADSKPERTSQAVGLAEALGWPVETREVGHPWWSPLADALPLPEPVELSQRRAQFLRPPWPDLVISTGPSTAAVARWIAAQSAGCTSVVALGHKGGDVAANFDLVATCSYVKYPPDERRVELQAPLCQVTQARLLQASERFPDLCRSQEQPRIVVLAGESRDGFAFDEAAARRLGGEIAFAARREGATAVVLTSPAVPPAAVAALEEAVSVGDAPVGKVHRGGLADHSYLAHLAGADAIVVTGQSDVLLAEACATGKPVYIFPLRKTLLSVGDRISDAVTAVAYSRPRKVKGTFRPQQGREYLCARLLQRGFVRPSKDLGAFHSSLVAGGYARMLHGRLEFAPAPVLNEAEVLTARVRTLLGMGCDSAQGSA